MGYSGKARKTGCLSNPVARVLVLVGAAICASVQSPPAHAEKWTSDAVRLTETDLMLLHPLCRAKTAQAKNRDVQAIWMKKFGPVWEHMHHYCFGSKALNLAYQHYTNSRKRTYFSTQAASEFNYVLDQAGGDFPMRAEILVQRGRAQVISREYEDAKSSFDEALKIDPTLVDGWGALSDMYAQMGRNADAIAVLEKAIEVTGGEHKKITARLEDLRKKHAR